MKNKTPCILIKIVSNSISGGYTEFLETKNTAASMCLDISDKIITQI